MMSLTLSVAGIGGAHPTSTGFSDTYDRLGGLPIGPNDPYQALSGSWTIVDQSEIPGIPQAGQRRVLMQNSRASTPRAGTNDPLEPMVFLRGRSFRSFTAQVTAALVDNVPTASVCLAFRAPILPNGDPDGSNLYLFCAMKTDIAPPMFTHGRVFALFKRVGRGYYLLTNQIANTWFDLTLPHDYKVVASAGRIQAFVDGRTVIDHTDQATGDLPTDQDPFPGLPFEAGAVGLRTSGARAWFDDFVVSGTPSYETRATIADVYTQTGRDLTFGASQTGTQRVSIAVGAQSTRLNRTGDTGFQYHDHDFDETTLRPAAGPGGQPSAGATLKTSGQNGTATATARLFGLAASFIDPLERVSVEFTADALEATATASCTSRSSALNIVNGSITVTITPIDGSPSTRVGPFPLQTTYAPNTVIHSGPNVQIVVHAQRADIPPNRVEAAVLKVVFPELSQRVGGINIGPIPIPSVDVTPPALEVTIGGVVAARYCS